MEYRSCLSVTVDASGDGGITTSGRSLPSRRDADKDQNRNAATRIWVAARRQIPAEEATQMMAKDAKEQR